MEEEVEACVLSVVDSGSKRKHVADDEEIVQSPKSLKPSTSENEAATFDGDVAECKHIAQQTHEVLAGIYLQESLQCEQQQQSSSPSYGMDTVTSEQHEHEESPVPDIEHLAGKEPKQTPPTTVENLTRYCCQLQRERDQLKQQLAETKTELEQRRTELAEIPQYRDVLGDITDKLEAALPFKESFEGTIARLFEQLKRHCNTLLAHRDALRAEAIVLRRDLRCIPKRQQKEIAVLEEMLARNEASYIADMRCLRERHAAATLTAAKVVAKLNKELHEKEVAMHRMRREHELELLEHSGENNKITSLEAKLATKEACITELTESCTGLTAKLKALSQLYSSFKELSEVSVQIAKIKDVRIIDLERSQSALMFSLSNNDGSQGLRREGRKSRVWQVPPEYSADLADLQAKVYELRAELRIIDLERSQSALMLSLSNNEGSQGSRREGRKSRVWQVPPEYSADLADLQAKVYELRAELRRKSTQTAELERGNLLLRLALERTPEESKRLLTRDQGRVKVIAQAVTALRVAYPAEHSLCSVIAMDLFPRARGAALDFSILEVFGLRDRGEVSTPIPPQIPQTGVPTCDILLGRRSVEAAEAAIRVGAQPIHVGLGDLTGDDPWCRNEALRTTVMPVQSGGPDGEF